MQSTTQTPTRNTHTRDGQDGTVEQADIRSTSEKIAATYGQGLGVPEGQINTGRIKQEKRLTDCQIGHFWSPIKKSTIRVRVVIWN